MRRIHETLLLLAAGMTTTIPAGALQPLASFLARATEETDAASWWARRRPKKKVDRGEADLAALERDHAVAIAEE